MHKKDIKNFFLKSPMRTSQKFKKKASYSDIFFLVEYKFPVKNLLKKKILINYTKRLN